MVNKVLPINIALTCKYTHTKTLNQKKNVLYHDLFIHDALRLQCPVAPAAVAQSYNTSFLKRLLHCMHTICLTNCHVSFTILILTKMLLILSLLEFCTHYEASSEEKWKTTWLSKRIIPMLYIGYCITLSIFIRQIKFKSSNQHLTFEF